MSHSFPISEALIKRIRASTNQDLCVLAQLIAIAEIPTDHELVAKELREKAVISAPVESQPFILEALLSLETQRQAFNRVHALEFEDVVTLSRPLADLGFCPRTKRILQDAGFVYSWQIYVFAETNELDNTFRTWKGKILGIDRAEFNEIKRVFVTELGHSVDSRFGAFVKARLPEPPPRVLLTVLGYPNLPVEAECYTEGSDKTTLKIGLQDACINADIPGLAWGTLHVDLRSANKTHPNPLRITLTFTNLVGRAHELNHAEQDHLRDGLIGVIRRNLRVPKESEKDDWDVVVKFRS